MKRLLLASLCAAALTACGGGGGSGSAGGPVPSVPVPTPTAAPIQAVSVQRSDASQALTSYNGAQASLSFGGVGGTPIASVRRRIDAAARRLTAAYRQGYRAERATRPQSVTYSACSNGTESAIVTVSVAEEQLYERVFYDAGCTKLYEDIFLDVIATSQTAARATGNATLFSQTGAVFDYETMVLTIAGVGTATTSFSIVLTDAPSVSAPTTAAFGVACNASTSALGCGVGVTERISGLSQDIGATVAVNATIPAGTGIVTVPVNGTGNAYTGGLGALSLSPGTFPNFIVSGGTLVDSATFNGSFTFAQNGSLVAASFSLSDAASDGTVTVSSSGTPATAVNGTVKRTSTGQVLATFTTDMAGNGTISYSNGTTGQIINWKVFG